MRLRLVALLVTLAAVLSTVLGEKSLYTQIYTSITADPCVRLLTADNVIGCTGGEHGDVAPLFHVATQDDFNAFTKDPPKEHQAVLLDSTLFNGDNLKLLEKTKKVKGVLVVGTTPPTSAYSSASKYPNQAWGINPKAQYAWNTNGDDLNSQALSFPIFAVTDSTNYTRLIDNAKSNVKSGDKYPRYSAKFNNFMYATKNAETCFRRGQCDPVGGKSIWSSFSNLTAPNVIVAMANLDSNALFHNLATGGDGTVSGLVGLLAAIGALAQIQKPAYVNDLVFGFWSGESWGHIGSKKFVQDVQSFKCEHYSKDKSYCLKPYKISLAFERFQLQKVKALVELNQINAADLYLHVQDAQGGNAVVDALTKVSNAATGSSVTFHAVDNTASKLPGVPPSSVESFLAANMSIPATVVTDYAATFANKYYDTQFDDGSNLNATFICDAATLTARALYTMAAEVDPSDSVAAAIKANCTEVALLLECLTSNFNCALVRTTLDLASNELDLADRATYYTGVFSQGSIGYQTVSMAAKFIGTYVTYLVAKPMKNPNGSGVFCDKSNECNGEDVSCLSIHQYDTKGKLIHNCYAQDYTYFHDAISPGLDWDYDNQQWKIIDKTQPIFAESSWGETSVEIFLQDSPTIEGLFLAYGIFQFVGSVVAVYFSKRYFLRHFKIL